jgi:hypothetical protein
MPANDWSLGTLYIQPNGKGGVWSQPGGPGTTVFPQQASSNVDYFSTAPFNELSGQYVFGCGHSANNCEVYRDYDYDNAISVAILACPLCSYAQRTIEPYEAATTGSSNAALANLILYP